LDNIRNADFIFTISEATRQDVISYLNKSPDRVLNVSGGVSSFFVPVPEHEHNSWHDKFSTKFKLYKKFVLCVGGQVWHKNIEGLMLAFAALPQGLKQSHQLVIACKLSDSYTNHLYQLSTQLDINDSLIITNYVTDIELRALYSMCSLFVFPSFYEGFGLPLLEAMSCGAPVIASNISSLPEIIGSAGQLFDPESSTDIAKAMQTVLSDENLQQVLSDRSIERAAQFTWQSVASKMSDVFLAEQPLLRVSVLFNRVNLASNKTKLAFFSSFKPLKSGIANSTHDLLPSLSDKFELSLYRDDDPDYTYTLNASTIENLIPSSLFENNLLDRQYESIIYHVGNNSHHCYIYSSLMRYAGISVLHDYALGGLINYMDAHRLELGITLLEELEHNYGLNRANEIANLIKKGKLDIVDLSASEIYINRRIFTRSLGVILHSKWAYKEAVATYSQDNSCIAYVPLVVPKYISPNISSTELREKLNIPEDSIVVSTFGFVNITKRPIPILHAFYQFYLKNPDAFLIFVGGTEYLGLIDLENEVRKLRLQGRVKITGNVEGYVDMQKFYEYIEVSDICLNLRFPSHGETSGALLRVLSVGKPTVVTDIGSFSDFPDDTVFKIPQPDRCDEVAEILKALTLLTENIEYRNSLSEKASAYVAQEHSPQRCADLYADFIHQVLRSPEAKIKMLADHVGRESAKLKITNPQIMLNSFSQMLE
jgi:glycosyltransferase involved in cell wall biosynthesis